MKNLTVSASPHVRSSETVTGIMLDVIIALITAMAVGVWQFGLKALLLIAVSLTMVSCQARLHRWMPRTTS